MIIDCNVALGHWPFLRPVWSSAAELDRHLAAEGIDRALVWSAESVFFEEPDTCNRDLEVAVAGYPRLVPVPVASPRVRSWVEIVERPGLVAVKLIPNYHVYRLTDPGARELAARVASRGVPLLIQMRIEDERSHYELLKVPGVPVDDIEALARALPNLTIVAQCPYLGEAERLAQLPNVYVDFSFAETLDTLGRLCAQTPAAKVVFGSHSPWLYTRAAVRKLETGSIGEPERQSIASRTAARLFPTLKEAP